MVQKGFKILLFIFFVFISFNVSASEFNMNSYTSATKGGTKNRYRGTEIDNTGTANTYTFNTQYSGRLSIIETYFDYPFTENTTYRLTYNMNTDDFRNNFGARYWWDCDHEMNATNQHLGNLTFVSYKKVQFTFTPTESTTCIRVMIGSSNASTGAITGVSNWRLNSITIYDPDWQSGGSGGSGQGTSTPTPTPVSTPSASNQDIINNANDNTQDIINNNNENTDNIINNANDNTQEIINNNNANTTCPVGPYRITRDEWSDIDGKYLSSDGTEVINSSFSITPYLIVKPNTTYHIFVNGGSMSGTTYYCLYTNSKAIRSCSQLITSSSFGTLEFTTDNYTGFLRLTLSNSRIISLEGPVCNDWEKEGLNNIKNSIDNLNNSITSDNVDSGVGSSFFDDFSSSDNGGISSIVTKPLTIVDLLLDSNNSCTDLSLPSFMGVSNANLPSGCILWDRTSSSIRLIWYTFVCGLGSYYILKDLFKIIEKLKNPDNDSVEVIDL